MSWLLDSEWRKESACSRVDDPDRFFPDGRPSDRSRSLCAGCPVRTDCLDFAVSSPWQPYGIWGGLTAKQLAPLWRAAHSTRRT